MLGGWKVEGVSELSDLILQSAAGAGINSRGHPGKSDFRSVSHPEASDPAVSFLCSFIIFVFEHKDNTFH